MSAKWKQDWFIERTSPPTENIVLPIFWNKSFAFLPGEEPVHANAYPFFSTISNAIELHGRTREGSFYPLAVNITEIATASLLVHARVRRLEASSKLFKSTDDVCVLREDGTLEYRYIGKTED